MSSTAPVHRIQYASIADSRRIWVEVGEKKKYRELVENVMERCALDVRKSFVDEKMGITVNYISEGDRIWLCVADKELSGRVAFAYLEYVKKRSPLGSEKESSSKSSSPTSNTASTSSVLANLMSSQLNTYTSSTDRIAQVNAEIAAIKEVMIDNLAPLLRRGERLEDLVEKSDKLQADAKIFHSNSAKLKNHFRWANLRWYLIGLVVLLLIAAGITWGVCGLRFQNCRKKKD